MTKSTSKIMPVAALSAVAAALLIGPGAVAADSSAVRHSNPPPEPIETLRGICNLAGTTYSDTHSFGSSSEKTDSRGTCVGSFNGDRIRTHTVRLVTRSTRPLIDLRSQGTGWIRVGGYYSRLHFTFDRVVGSALVISGAAGSSASATLHRQTGDRQTLVLQAASQLQGM